MTTTDPSIVESATPANYGAASANLSVDGSNGPVGGTAATALAKGLQTLGQGLQRREAPALTQQHLDDFHTVFGVNSGAATNLMTAAPQAQQIQAQTPIVAPPPPPPPLATMSDARAKRGIHDGSRAAMSFLEALERDR